MNKRKVKVRHAFFSAASSTSLLLPMNDCSKAQAAVSSSASRRVILGSTLTFEQHVFNSSSKRPAAQRVFCWTACGWSINQWKLRYYQCEHSCLTLAKSSTVLNYPSQKQHARTSQHDAQALAQHAFKQPVVAKHVVCAPNVIDNNQRLALAQQVGELRWQVARLLVGLQRACMTGCVRLVSVQTAQSPHDMRRYLMHFPAHSQGKRQRPRQTPAHLDQLQQLLPPLLNVWLLLHLDAISAAWRACGRGVLDFRHHAHAHACRTSCVRLHACTRAPNKPSRMTTRARHYQRTAKALALERTCSRQRLS